MKAFFKVLRTLFWVVLVLLVLGLLGGGGYAAWWWWTSASSAPGFRTAKVTRDKLVATISATGTIEPEDVVDVGAQVNGVIEKFGVDPRDKDKSPTEQRLVDYCTPVEPNTVLAEIDPRQYAADVKAAEKTLAVDEANIEQAKAALEQANSKLGQTQREWERNKRLGPGGAVTQTDYDTALNAYETAKADVPAREAAVAQAKAILERDKAVLAKAQVNLDYCTIKAPVKGVIVDRRVNVGQTVVSSFTTSSLFLLAKDLTHLQVWASVNEADVGNIYIGQPVTFTVDARPGKTFKGVVEQVRYNATMTQNVVTYTVVVATDNMKVTKPDHPVKAELNLPSGRKILNVQDEEYMLLPYLTANLQFIVAQRDDTLLVPNAALRYHPDPSQVAPEDRDAYQEQQQRHKGPPSDQPKGDKGDKGDGGEKPRHNEGYVWVQDGGFLKPVKVATGVTDGSQTEVVKVLDGNLSEGDEVVTGENKPGAGGPPGSGTTNPFAPPRFGGQRPQQKKDQ